LMKYYILWVDKNTGDPGASTLYARDLLQADAKFKGEMARLESVDPKIDCITSSMGELAALTQPIPDAISDTASLAQLRANWQELSGNLKCKEN